jgi:curved DNA-binding protein CbpA
MKPASAVRPNPARLLAEAARGRSSGIFKAARGKLKRLVCINEGRIVLVASNIIEEQLEQFLIKKEIVTAEQLESLATETDASGGKPVMLLLQRRLISPEDLYDRASERVRELLFSTFEWREGEFEFTPGRPNLEGELTVDLPCLPLIFEHAQRHPRSISEVRSRIGPPNMRPLADPDAVQWLDELKIDTMGRELLDLCKGALSASELIAKSPLSTEESLRMLYGLVQVGLVRASTQVDPTIAAEGEPVTREEVLAQMGRIGDDATHYAVLALPPRATTGEVRNAYYYLARRYHPDRFRSGDMRDLLEQVEGYFTKVTEAYNTLYEPDLRRQYDDELKRQAGTKKTETQQDKGYLARQNFARGKMAIDRKQFQDAAKFFENALELDPSRAVYHLELGRVLVRNPRRRNEAEELLRTAAQMNPALVDTYLGLGELYTKTGRAEEAVEAYNEVLRWEPTNAEATERLRALGQGGRGRVRRKGLFGG